MKTEITQVLPEGSFILDEDLHAILGGSFSSFRRLLNSKELLETCGPLLPISDSVKGPSSFRLKKFGLTQHHVLWLLKHRRISKNLSIQEIAMRIRDRVRCNEKEPSPPKPTPAQGSPDLGWECLGVPIGKVVEGLSFEQRQTLAKAIADLGENIKLSRDILTFKILAIEILGGQPFPKLHSLVRKNAPEWTVLPRKTKLPKWKVPAGLEHLSWFNSDDPNLYVTQTEMAKMVGTPLSYVVKMVAKVATKFQIKSGDCLDGVDDGPNEPGFTQLRYVSIPNISQVYWEDMPLHLKTKLKIPPERNKYIRRVKLQATFANFVLLEIRQRPIPKFKKKATGTKLEQKPAVYPNLLLPLNLE